MTRRKIIFTDASGKQYVTPEFNGDKTEFEKFQMGDTCTAEWADIMKLFVDVSTLDEFRQANKKAQSHYISQLCPNAEPERFIYDASLKFLYRAAILDLLYNKDIYLPRNFSKFYKIFINFS